MRIGINVNPSNRGQPATLDELIEQVAGYSRRGFQLAAFANLTSGYDALTTIALTGRVVPDIELATSVVPVYTRHPLVMAQQALTTHVAIGGRLTLGLGLSHRPVGDDAYGMSFERPVEYMQEYLAILKPLLHGEAVAFSGRRFKSQAQMNVPQASPPSVVLAALGERMLWLAGAQTDGTAT